MASVDIKCPVCLEILDNPVSAPCGHPICADHSSKCSKCPVCRADTPLWYHSYTLKRICDSVTRTCEGCGFKGNRAEMNEHKRMLDYRSQAVNAAYKRLTEHFSFSCRDKRTPSIVKQALEQTTLANAKFFIENELDIVPQFTASFEECYIEIMDPVNFIDHIMTELQQEFDDLECSFIKDIQNALSKHSWTQVEECLNSDYILTCEKSKKLLALLKKLYMKFILEHIIQLVRDSAAVITEQLKPTYQDRINTYSYGILSSV